MKTRYFVGMVVLFLFMLVGVPDIMEPLRPRLSAITFYVIVKALQGIAAIMMFIIVQSVHDQAFSDGSEHGQKATIGKLRRPNRDEIYQLREILASDIPGRFALCMDIILPPQNASDPPSIAKNGLGLFFAANEEEITGIRDEFKRRGGRTAFYIHYVNSDVTLEGKKTPYGYMIYDPYRFIPGGLNPTGAVDERPFGADRVHG